MAEKSTKVLAVLLMVSCMVAYVPTGLALRPIEHKLFHLPTGFFSDCWKAFTGLNGCGTQFYAAIVTGGYDRIRPTCCHAINSIVNRCWHEFFHNDPSIPPSLKRYCVQSTTVAKPLSQDNLHWKPIISSHGDGGGGSPCVGMETLACVNYLCGILRFFFCLFSNNNQSSVTFECSCLLKLPNKCFI